MTLTVINLQNNDKFILDTFIFNFIKHVAGKPVALRILVYEGVKT